MEVVGIIYLAGMVIGIGGNILIQSIPGVPDPLSVISLNSMKLAVGAILCFIVKDFNSQTITTGM